MGAIQNRPSCMSVKILQEESSRDLCRSMIENDIYPTAGQLKAPIFKSLLDCGALLVRGPPKDARFEWASYTQEWPRNPAWTGDLRDPTKKQRSEKFHGILGELLGYRERLSDVEVQTLVDFVAGLKESSTRPRATTTLETDLTPEVSEEILEDVESESPLVVGPRESREIIQKGKQKETPDTMMDLMPFSEEFQIPETIDSLPNSGPRAKTACVECRRHKFKCINSGPNSICEACKSKEQKCLYARRKEPRKEGGKGPRKERARKVCDACRRRKSKCANTGPNSTCKACEFKGQECSYSSWTRDTTKDSGKNASRENSICHSDEDIGEDSDHEVNQNEMPSSAHVPVDMTCRRESTVSKSPSPATNELRDSDIISTPKLDGVEGNNQRGLARSSKTSLEDSRLEPAISADEAAKLATESGAADYSRPALNATSTRKAPETTTFTASNSRTPNVARQTEIGAQQSKECGIVMQGKEKQVVPGANQLRRTEELEKSSGSREESYNISEGTESILMDLEIGVADVGHLGKGASDRSASRMEFDMDVGLARADEGTPDVPNTSRIMTGGPYQSDASDPSPQTPNGTPLTPVFVDKNDPAYQALSTHEKRSFMAKARWAREPPGRGFGFGTKSKKQKETKKKMGISWMGISTSASAAAAATGNGRKRTRSLFESPESMDDPERPDDTREERYASRRKRTKSAETGGGQEHSVLSRDGDEQEDVQITTVERMEALKSLNGIAILSQDHETSNINSRALTVTDETETLSAISPIAPTGRPRFVSLIREPNRGTGGTGDKTAHMQQTNLGVPKQVEMVEKFRVMRSLQDQGMNNGAILAGSVEDASEELGVTSPILFPVRKPHDERGQTVLMKEANTLVHHGIEMVKEVIIEKPSLPLRTGFFDNVQW